MGRGNPLAEGADSRGQQRLQLRVQHAQGAAQLYALRNNVVRLRRGKLSHRHDGALQRVNRFGNHAVEGADYLRADVDAVNALVGKAAVAPLSMDHNFNAVDSGVGGAVFEADIPRLRLRVHMRAKDQVNIVQNAGRYHLAGAAPGALLTGLEDELDCSADGLRTAGENPCRREEHGRIAVVAAGVHHALVHRPVGGVVRLHNRQRVNIGAGAIDAARLIPPEDGHHPRGAGARDGQVPAGRELVKQILRGFKLPGGHLRVLMEVSPGRNDLLLPLCRQGGGRYIPHFYT